MEKPMSPAIKKGSGYPREFGEEAVKHWLSSGKKASIVAHELGVSDWKGIAGTKRWKGLMSHPLAP